MDPRDLLKSLKVVNANGEKAEDSIPIVKFAKQTLLELPDLDAFKTVKTVARLLSELSRFGASNKIILQSREMIETWKSELISILDAINQLDSLASQFKLPACHFYLNENSIRYALQLSVAMLSAYSIPFDEIEKLLRKNLAGEDETYKDRLSWVLHVLCEGPLQLNVAAIVGTLPQYDRPTGGGARKEQNIGLANACRRLNEALPEFAKNQWQLQAELLMWAGLGKIQRNQVHQAVVGNRRRQD